MSFYQYYYYYLLWFYFVFSFKTTPIVVKSTSKTLRRMIFTSMLKIQWWTLPVFDLISKILYYWNCIENLGQRNKFQRLLPIGDKGSLYTQLLDKGVYLQNKDKSPPFLVSNIRKEKPPTLWRWCPLRLTRNIAPPGQKIKMVMRDWYYRLILNIDIKPPNLDSFKKC